MSQFAKSMTSRQIPVKPEEVKPWFYRIVVNTALDFLRKHKLVELMGETGLASSLGSEDTYADPDLHQALGNLPLHYRSVIILRYFEDLKIEEIAVILGENVNTVKTRLYSALKKLRLQLQD